MKNLNEVPFGKTIVEFLLMYFSLKHIAIFIIIYTICAYFFILFGGILSLVWFIETIGLKNVFLLFILIVVILFVCWMIYIIMYQDTLETIQNFANKKREEKNDC